MTIEEKVQALLEAGLPSYGSPPTEIVPTDRIRVPGDWQNLTLPYVVHQPVAEEPAYMHSGRIDLNEWPFYQVSAFASTYSGARVVIDAVIATLEGNQDSVEFISRGIHPMPYETDTKVQQIAVDFQIFEAL